MVWDYLTGPQTTLLSCCFTSTEARWPIRDGERVGRGRESEGSTEETVRERPKRPWTAARTMELLRRCALAIAQRLVHWAFAVSTAVLDRVTKTISVALLLTNNLDNLKMSNLLSPAPTLYSWSPLGKIEGSALPLSSKIFISFDHAWNPAADHVYSRNYIQVLTRPRYCGTCSIGQVHWKKVSKMHPWSLPAVKWMKLGCVVPTFPWGP